MMRHVLLIVSTFLCAVVPVMGQSLTPRDFARGIPVEIVEGESVQALVMPQEVYQTVTRADLGDVRVFNGNDEVVPHAVYEDGLIRSQPEVGQDLPIFPIYGRPGADPGNLLVQVRRSPSGDLIRIEDRPDRPDSPRFVSAYIVDASRIEDPIRQLNFIWSDTSSFLTDVSIATSEDLRNWHVWGSPTTLSNLKFGADTLHRNEVTLPSQEVEYLRITWSDYDLSLPLRSVKAFTTGWQEPERQWAEFEPSVPEEGVFVFDQNARYPVDRVRFELPQPNTLVRAELSSASSPDGPWQVRFSGLLYRLRIQGRDLDTPSISVPDVVHRYWRLKVDPAGGGLGSQRPLLELGWTPGLLLFIPRGESPYILAFGSSRTEPSQFDPNELLQLIPNRNVEWTAERLASTGASVELGGEGQLSPRREIPMNQLLLWGVLILGVILLAFMSIRLIRQVDRDREVGAS